MNDKAVAIFRRAPLPVRDDKGDIKTNVSAKLMALMKNKRREPLPVRRW